MSLEMQLKTELDFLFSFNVIDKENKKYYDKIVNRIKNLRQEIKKQQTTPQP